MTEGTYEHPGTREGSAKEQEATLSVAPGDKIGRYEILQHLGEGGMGIVFAAFDPRLGRKVALKLLRTNLGEVSRDTSDQARLLREAQAMAQLSHPNVVAVYDAGTFQGEVYVAMELVDGVTADEWGARSRSWREVVKLFLAAGQGLAAAHAAGIVHRDFKPGNVLVGAQGEVKVADFGLARPANVVEADSSGAIASDLSDAIRPRLTRSGTMLGTPAYMAPEQHRGEVADARTDQFSFCLALYEALYGERPFRGDTVAELRESLQRGIVRGAPRTTKVPAWLRRIVVRGLSGDRDERFGTMPELLDALGKGLSARQRRTLFVAAVLAAVATSAAVGLPHALRDRCGAGATDLAAVWNAKERAAIRTVFLGTELVGAEGVWSRAGSALDRYALRWVSTYRVACEATRARSDPSEDLLDRRMWCLRGRLGELRALIRVFQQADAAIVRRAIEAVHHLTPIAPCAQVAGPKVGDVPPSDPAKRVRVERARNALSQALALQRAGKFERAVVRMKKVVAAAARLAYPPLHAETVYRQGVLFEEAGQAKKASAALSEAISLAHVARRDRLAVRATAKLGYVLAYRERRFREARRWLTLAAAGARRVGEDPLLESEVRGSIGVLHFVQRRNQDAARHFEGALRLAAREPEADPLVLADLRTSLGVAHSRLGNQERALAQHRLSLKLLEKEVGPRHRRVASVLSNISSALTRQGRYAEALPIARRVVRIRRAALPRDHIDLIYGLHGLGKILQGLGQYREAVEVRREAVRRARRRFGPRHAATYGALNRLGTALVSVGRYDEAVAVGRRALEAIIERRGPAHIETAMLRSSLSVSLGRAGKLDEAIRESRRVLAAYRKHYGPRHRYFAASLTKLGANLSRAGRLKEALDLLRRALEILEEKLGPRHPSLATALMHIGVIHHAAGRYPEALVSYRRALALREKALGAKHPLVGATLAKIGTTLLSQRHFAQARTALERALAIQVARTGRPGVVAKTRFFLAQALWAQPRTRHRAMRLARLAKQHYARSKREPKVLGEINRWVKRRRTR